MCGIQAKLHCWTDEVWKQNLMSKPEGSPRRIVQWSEKHISYPPPKTLMKKNYFLFSVRMTSCLFSLSTDTL